MSGLNLSRSWFDVRVEGRNLRSVRKMTLIQIEKRVKALEETVRGLRRPKPRLSRRWYRTHAGRFAHDPVFDEIMKLGQAYRKGQRLLPHLKRP